ncbi:hypothetical protein HK105_204565 [Polyrhizophydium stewartii]|uniref:Uncharacterized protein n=1 Tax=Polyrhizophydium stewartii TaxID=2732419 RepID=A0ABR4N8M2_9FUNG
MSSRYLPGYEIRGEKPKADFPWFSVPGLFDAPALALEAAHDDPGGAGSSASAPTPALALEAAPINTAIRKRFILSGGISISIMTEKVNTSSSQLTQPPSASVPPLPLPSASSSTSCDKDATSSSSKRNYIGNMPHYDELVHLGFHFVCTMDSSRKNYVMIRIAPIDPNCNYPGEEPKTKRGLKKVHHRAIFVKISKAEFKRARRIHQHQQVREHMQKRERRQRTRDGKIDIFDDMPSIKGTSIANVEKLFEFLAADGLPVTGDMLDGKGCRFGEMTRYYVLHVFRRMHMDSYSAKQHWLAHVQDRIYETIERLRPA